jgi:hypothetical protein
MHVSNFYELIKFVLKKVHNVLYVGHIGYQKTMTTLRIQYFWLGIKNIFVDCIVKCMKCQRIKIKH